MKIFAILALFLAVAGGLVGTFYLGRQASSMSPDLSTPRNAVASFFNCLSMGHAAGAIECVLNQPEQEALAGELAGIVGAGLDPDDLTALPLFELADLDGAVIDLEGDPADAARVTLATQPDEQAKDVDRPGVVILRKTGDQWQVDLLATTGLSGEEATQYVEQLRNATAQLTE